MRSCVLQLSLAAALCLSSGCGAVRCIEQWKCDNFGMCHFGITPSVAPGYAPSPDPCAPPPYYPLPPANCAAPLEIQSPYGL